MESRRRGLWAFAWGREDGVRAQVRNHLLGLILGTDDSASSGANNSELEQEVRPQDEVDGLTKVAAVSDLEEGSVIEVRYGDDVVALSMVNGEVFAVSNVCPHAGGPVGDGELSGHILTCPTHGWSFDVRDGTCDVDSRSKLDVFEAKIEKGRIYLVNK